MGDIIIVLMLISYVAFWIYYWRYCHKRSKPLTEADIAKLEQMIKDYKE